MIGPTEVEPFREIAPVTPEGAYAAVPVESMAI